MSKKDMIEAGLRVLGFWLLLTSSIALVGSASQFAISYSALKKDPKITELGLFGVQTRGVGADALDDVARRTGHQMGYFTAQSLMAASIVKLLFAVYLCKGGKWVVSWLAPD